MEEVEGLGKPSSTSSVAAGQRKKKKTTESADTVQIQWETPEVAKQIPAYSKTLEKFGGGLSAAAHRTAWNPPRHRPWLRSAKDGQLSFAKPAGV